VIVLFADTSFWVAILNRRDPLYRRAHESSGLLSGASIYTTDLVLAELLNTFAEGSTWLRSIAAQYVNSLLAGGKVTIERLTPDSFDAALKLYSERRDKGWSLTDCHSFLLMQRHGIDSALTADRQFEQAGFKTLLR
jgi:predicted nucleic acid-binding protein